MNCYERIANDIANDICAENYGRGVKAKAYYIDEEDIDRAKSTFDTATSTITKLVLKDEKKAIRMFMPSNSPYSGLTNEDQNAAIGMSFNKTVPIVLLSDSPENSKNVAALKMRKGVVIYEQNAKGKNGEQAFIVVGWEQGVSGQNAKNEKYSEDTQGGWAVNLVEEGAKTPQIFFFESDYETTKDALESLCE